MPYLGHLFVQAINSSLIPNFSIKCGLSLQVTLKLPAKRIVSEDPTIKHLMCIYKKKFKVNTQA